MATNRPQSLQVFDPVLSNVARSYRSNGLIARDLIPTIRVATLSGQYPVFTKAFWFQLLVDNRYADRAPAREVDFEWSTEGYLCAEYALKVSITELEKLQALQVLRLEQGKAELLTQQMELSYEARVAGVIRATSQGGKLTGTSDGTGAVAAAGLWTTLATATVEKDIANAALGIYKKTGKRPNTMVIPYPIAYGMAVNSTFRTLLRYDATGQPINFISLGGMVLPNVIHGMRVIVPEGAQLDSSNQGAASESIGEIWGTSVRLLWIDPSAGWGQPTTAYRMEHTAKRVTRWSQVDPDLEYIRELERYDLKVVAPDTGVEITGAGDGSYTVV